jgi:hypothetical protein
MGYVYRILCTATVYIQLSDDIYNGLYKRSSWGNLEFDQGFNSVQSPIFRKRNMQFSKFFGGVANHLIMIQCNSNYINNQSFTDSVIKLDLMIFS